jgi:glucosamine-6-phosphate deaminase
MTTLYTKLTSGARMADNFQRLGSGLQERLVRNHQVTWANDILITPSNNDTFGEVAAQQVGDEIRRLQASKKGNINVIFATGNTMKPFLKYLVQQNGIDWTRINAFHLDEYRGLNHFHPASFARFLKDNLFDPLTSKDEKNHILEENIYFVADFVNKGGKEIDDYSVGLKAYIARLEDLGGADVIMLGLGRDGHIAFVNQNTPFNEDMQMVELSEETLADNEPDHPDIRKNPFAFTMGPTNITTQGKIFFLVNGQRKSTILTIVLTGELSTDRPAKVLRNLPAGRVTAIFDEAAASQLGARLATSSELLADEFFHQIGARFSRGAQKDLSLMDNDFHFKVYFLTRGKNDILIVRDTQTGQHVTYDVSKRKLIELQSHELEQPTDVTDFALKLYERNESPLVPFVDGTARVVFVDSFTNINDAFYMNLILRFSQTLGQKSQVIFVSKDIGEARRIAALAQKLDSKNKNNFVAKTMEELKQLESQDLSISYLLEDSYLDKAKTLYGPNKNYFSLESSKKEGFIGNYAFVPLGVLMDLVAVGNWYEAANVYNQITSSQLSPSGLRNRLKSIGALIVSLVSELFWRTAAHVYMAERAFGRAA